ncbi:MAG: hypothetical protein U5K43_13860 [Halofilum sp. (in: g-proteobacteria)]|nr:hypothetical protein [Halofilum sp. (in: g-proteobacteria)]
MFTDTGDYYAVAASLPSLPRFDRAKRLPITRRQLDARLAMLSDEDRGTADDLEHFLEWQHHPVEEDNLAILQAYEVLLEQTDNVALREMMIHRTNLRTIMAALRRRQGGHGPPGPGEIWGAGRWVRHVETNWSDPHLGLSAAQPWVTQAAELLAAGESLELERLLMGLVWDHLSRLTETRPFSLEHVLAYVFKWDILSRWLAYDVTAARDRLEELTSDAIDGHSPLFG